MTTSKSKKAKKKVTSRFHATADAKITKGKAHAFREGTDRHAQYALAIKSGTVSKFDSAGGDRAFLNWYRRNGYVRVGS